MQKITCEILEVTEDQVKFSLDNCDVSLANALRRVMISEVPTMAVHLVNIYENTSVLHDEFLVQRVALIPFVSDAIDKYKYTWECNCGQNPDECQVCKVYFVLQVKNEDVAIREVSSLDIRSVFDNAELSGDFRPVEPVKYTSKLTNQPLKIPIVKLSQNQEINIRFDVQKGIAKMHSKWCPVTIATFHPQPQIRVDYEKMQRTPLEIKEKIVNSCPTRVYQLKNDILEVAHPERCIYCQECVKVCDNAKLTNLVKVGRKKEKFIFTVEGTGVLPPTVIVKKAIQVLMGKLKTLQTKIS